MSRFQDRFPPGTLIGERYKVIKRFEGGISEVYQCIDALNDELIALKTLKPHLIDDKIQLRRFRDEINLWVGLNKHPNIVFCRGVDLLNEEIPFMFLEWVSNEQGRSPDLRGWIEYRALEVKTAIEIAADICAGMIHANEMYPLGIVHLDLKPDNVLIAPGMVAKITDFGMGRIISREQEHQLSGGAKGTALYMAPEQWELAHGNENMPLNQTTDIYALGCILYELLTGRTPFAGSFHQLRQMHIAHIPDFSGIPIKLQPIVQRCVEKSQEDRYQSFKEVFDDLKVVYENTYQAELNLRPPRKEFELSVSDYVNRAVTFFRISNYEKALEDLDRALGIIGRDSYLLALKGLANSYLGNHDVAIRLLESAKEMIPDDPQVLYVVGLTYFQSDDYESSFAFFDRAYAQDENYLGALYYRGLSQSLLGRGKEAIADLTGAIRMRNDIAELYYYRGLLHINGDSYNLGINDFTRAIEIKPRFADAYLERARVRFEKMRRYPEALEDIRTYLNLDADNPEAHMLQGLMRFKIGQENQAIASFNNVLRLDPNHVAAYCYRGQSYADLQKYDLALADFEKAIEIDPASAFPYSLRGGLYRQLNQPEKALADFETASQLDPEDTLHIQGRSIVFADSDQFEQAVAEVTKMIDVEPNEAQAYFLRGYFYEKLEDYEASLQDLDHALELDPESTYIRLRRANVLRKLERYDESVGAYEILLRLNPRNYYALTGMGRVLYAMEDVYGALNFFKRAIALGYPSSAYYYNEVAKDVGIPKLTSDPLTEILTIVINVQTVSELRNYTRQLPYMLDPQFLYTLQHIIIMTRSPRRANFIRRNLYALKQLSTRFRI